MIYSCDSHIGKIRKNNEDYCMGEVIQTKNEQAIGIFALADGMGGHNKGEVASKLAVDNILKFLKENLLQSSSIKIDYIDDIIKQAYNNVNSIIYKKSVEEEECFGMGTTLVTAILYKDNLYVANVGDSRCYLLSDDILTQVSIDHSVVEELLRANVITEEEARNHPRRNHITRAMGTEDMVIVDIFKYKLKENDLVLLATDGLTGCASKEDIISVLSKKEDIPDMSKNLIDMANEISGRDNVSVILIKV
ncbi:MULTISPECIES: Stp1/IreP family PP2C-type Ser/Thr phosphatase [unclassified Romboutsia]|uniref:Stp1/IreP family PP2C-type Ser/Thr phosphatase n=1 Tax=unclassified Romboutsia TaxID=2626894 RepID=UPI0008232DBA|nr:MULTISPECIES: Stp1/IreP family PP2C-type Ser/Thr phosphatase [unclassified Romboutsia]SCH13180.1 Serine/threonine phosphatase stp [uncultured Clostridium sp.]